MDGGSNRNVIEQNLVEDNGHDGMALIGSSDDVVADNVIRNHRVGVRVNDRGSDRNVLRNNVIAGNDIGVQAFGGATTTGMYDNTIEASRKTALLLDSPGSEVTGGKVRGAPRGMEIRAATRVADVGLSEVGQGIVVTATGSADVDHVDVAATDRSVQVRSGGSLRLQRSTLDAPSITRRSWMPLAGISAVSMAVLLQFVSHLRTRRRREVLAPPGVWNTT
jgi:parallel beta-helix repeat protein